MRRESTRNTFRDIQYFVGCPHPFVVMNVHGGIYSRHLTLEEAIAIRDDLELRGAIKGSRERKEIIWYA